MATHKNILENKLNNKRKSTHKVKIAPTGADTYFESADNAAKQVEAENTEETMVESQPIPEIAPKKQTKTTATASKKKKTTAAKTKPAPVEEKKEGEN